MPASTGNDPTAAMVKAVVLAQQGHADAALAELDSGAFAPPLAVAAALLAARLLEGLDVERCWETYTNALQDHPDHAIVHLRAGVFAYRRGDHARARALLERAWALAPNPETGCYLGEIHAARGDHARALGYLVQAAAFEDEHGCWRAKAERVLLASRQTDGSSV